jgi:hypothetical protein
MKFGTLQTNATAEIIELFTPVEGVNTVYYGKVRNGKTYSATCDILELLRRGEVVYANWEINFDDFDERENTGIVIMKFLFGKKYFFKYKKENFHYFSPDDIDVEFLSHLVGVHLFIDEGQWIFNSHVRENASDPVAIAKRRLILHGGHYCRTLNVITQRPVNLFKDIRSQINIWYKCSKRLKIGNFIIFMRETIEDMKDDIPDEEVVQSTKHYVGDKKIFKAYNTHAMRSKDAIDEMAKIEIYRTTFAQRLFLLARAVLPFVGRHTTTAAVQPASETKLAVKYIEARETRFPIHRQG